MLHVAARPGPATWEPIIILGTSRGFFFLKGSSRTCMRAGVHVDMYCSASYHVCVGS